MLVKEMHLFDNENFARTFLMCPKKFQLLLSWVAPLI